MDRLLAAEETPPLDYTVFSVVIATLVIVLVVEVLRHQLDVAASGNPFFQTVLELMYRELTTLGIVEFFIYLMHKYHENFNYAMEVVFVDVHFMLFYTALFNAIQSVLVRLVTSRRTDKAWIQTEDIDIGHYVAIRKEFDRVENEWKMLQKNSNTSSNSNMVNHDSTRSSSLNTSFHEAEESNNPSTWESFGRFWKDWYMKLRYPRLYLRKRKLLIPVRFHELRHHFIEQNGLTPKFKVSQYLKRSLTSVLLDFVHISSAAWIMVMALGILFYYLSGITLNFTADKYSVYELLAGALAAAVGLFLVISVVLFYKMRKIISRILVMKLTIEDVNTGRQNTFRGFSALQTKMKSIDQINLFWGGRPRIIIVLTQFMQFGYALGLAALFTYWKQLGSTEFKEKLLAVLLIGYGLYLHFLADILPWFTVCTSLGQLVNKEQLHETMAKMKLNEEVRRMEAAAEAAAIEKEISLRRRQVEEKLQAKKRQEEEMLKHKEFINSGSSQPQKHGRKKSLSGGVGFMRIFQDRGSMNSSDNSYPGHRKRRSLSDGVDIMSDLHIVRKDSFDAFHPSSKLSDAAAQQLFSANNDVADGDTRLLLAEQEERIQPKLNTGLFATTPPITNDLFVDRELNGTASSGLTREQRKHIRMKSKSEGVAFMRSSFDTAKFEALSELVNMPVEDLPPLEKPKKERSFRLKAISEGVSMMQMGPSSNDTPQATSFNNADSSNGLALSRHDRKQRRKRMKCQSEGVVLMRSSFDKTNTRVRHCSHVGEISNHQQPQLETLSELVNLPAKDLPQIPDVPKKRERKARLRAISDGVSLMKSHPDSTDQKPSFNYLLNSLSAAAEPITPDKKVSFPNEDNETLMDKSIDNTSVESVGGESDIDDVPDIMRDDLIVVRKQKMIGKVAALNWWVEILQCHRYHVLSLLFGPMACCFWIAMRVEGFNMVEGVLIDYHNTFHLDLKTSFWVETAWYCMMFAERFVALVVFAKSGNSKEIMSAFMGMCNVVTCCALLMTSEMKRCCHEDESRDDFRSLAADSSYTYYVSDGSSVAECTCSAFGSRLYGGLGIIEPFTFLMALGPIRYLIAGPIVRLFGAKTVDTHHPTHEQHGHQHGSDPDAVRNIWLTTIGLHGEVAKAHGLFSVEVLYCMLGLEMPEQKPQITDNISEIDSSAPFESTQASEKTSDVNSHQEAASPTMRNSLGIMFDEEEFSYPDSKLIRRMRRCERKMLPLLETWAIVDVVLTNHELVILEVPDNNDGFGAGALPDGGKGLRLADVVKGRNVVSTFLLDEIDFIDIEHSLRIAAGESVRDVESNSQDLGEFWEGCTDALTYDPTDMSSRWCHVDEDRLKIHFTGGCGTLYLRILADLKEKEATSKPIEADSSLLDGVGRETKIWCRTIARLCGVANLKMDLPHFGDATGDDELGDFIKVTERDSNGIKQHRRRITRLPSQRW